MGKGVQKCVLCWEVVPFLKGPLSEVPLYTPSYHHAHSYELVRTLHNRVEGAIGELVKAKVENRMQESDGQEGITKISNEVLASKE